MPASVMPALRAVRRLLGCPVCAARDQDMPLDGTARPGMLCCAQGHGFDLARQGYVSLLSGRGSGAAGDTTAMIAARSRFLGSGVYDPIRQVLAEAAAQVGAPGVVADVGCGTGYYLAGVLDHLPDRWGVGMDVAKPALRAAARVHPRAAAVGVDTWRRLPLRTGTAAVVLDVFAPRGPAEWARVLAPDGLVLTVTPTSAHLAELVAAFGLVSVDAHKDARLSTAMATDFVESDRQLVSYHATLTAEQITDLIDMGPSAFHREPAAAPEPASVVADRSWQVSVSVQIGVYRRRDRSAPEADTGS